MKVVIEVLILSVVSGLVLMIAWFLLTSAVFWRILFFVIGFSILGFLALFLIANWPSEGSINLKEMLAFR